MNLEFQTMSTLTVIDAANGGNVSKVGESLPTSDMKRTDKVVTAYCFTIFHRRVLNFEEWHF